MRLSSSLSEGLFGAVTAHGAVAVQVDDEAWLRALLDVEAALVRAVAEEGLVPAVAAAAVTQACADTSAYDIAALGRAAAASGNPVVPLVRAIEQRAGGHGFAVHHGATSQDVLDTAMVLVAQRALRVLAQDLAACVVAAARLAEAHRATPLAGRTLLQQAVPTTFGLKAAGWALALDGARRRLLAVPLPVQLGGAAGTLGAYGGRGTQVSRALAANLGLQPSVLPWHTLRLPVADLAGALGTTAGTAGKVAFDVVLLAQSEVAEVHEGGEGRGGSSAMPHKRNPVAAVQARAAARRAPGLVATLLSCMEQEHERAAGAWHAEWTPTRDLLLSAGTAVAWLRDCLEGLVVDPVRMRANLRASDELVAEALAAVLAPTLGRGPAHDLVAAAVRTAQEKGREVREVLVEAVQDEPTVTAEQRDGLRAASLDAGEAAALVDAALVELRRTAT